jgi:hypothetical protein
LGLISQFSMELETLYVTQLIQWRNKPCYITNIFVNGTLVVSPKGIDKYYKIHYTEINLVESN